MKKLIYLFMALGLIVSACSSDDPTPTPTPEPKPEPKPEPEPEPEPVPPITDLIFGYCTDVKDGLGVGAAGYSMEAAIEVPQGLSKAWRGNKITAIRVGYGKSSNKSVMVYITDDLTGYPIVSQNAEMTEEFGWNEVVLEEPYVLDGAPFYVGYQTVTRAASDSPIGIDLNATGVPYGDFIGLNNSFDHYGSQFGSVCVQFVMEGEDLPRNDAMLSGLDNPPYVVANSPFEAYMYLSNTGADVINSVEIGCSIGGQEVANTTVSLANQSIEPGNSTAVMVEGITYGSTGTDLPLEFYIKTVNGVTDDNSFNDKISSTISVGDNGYDKNVVVEEFTGTWCGFCPRGIVGMQYMRENYGDDGFIGIAVHYNDDMQSTSYVTISNTFSNGSYPSAVVDRAIYFDPAADTMEYYFLYQKRFISSAGISLEANYSESENVIKVKSVAEFALGVENANYKIAYAITEDQVGPYSQTNYFAGGQNGGLEGWSTKPAKVSWLFDEVGRYILAPFGIDGSLPISLKPGEKYTYEANLPVNTVDEINNCHVVAMIIDAATGQIVNGVQVALNGTATKAATAPRSARTVKGGCDMKASSIAPANMKTFKKSDKADNLKNSQLRKAKF